MAAWYVTVHTSKFTDYILPWLIAAAAVVPWLLWPAPIHATLPVAVLGPGYRLHAC
jgi:hypothetical protein